MRLTAFCTPNSVMEILERLLKKVSRYGWKFTSLIEEVSTLDLMKVKMVVMGLCVKCKNTALNFCCFSKV
jgi:hypothetical protein